MKTNFLLINAIDSSKSNETNYPPLGIGYLISSLRNKFGERSINFRVVDTEIEKEINNFSPDIVGISAVSQNYNKAAFYAKIAKKFGIPVLCGGVHISMMPLSLTRHMDVGVIGEGEITICDLFDLFIKKRKLYENDLKKIKGIIYWKKDGKIATTEKREQISPLDSIQFPARDLLNIKSKTYMFTTRGCAYRCSFCASSRFWKKVRFFSAEYVVNEIELLVNKYNVNHISFQDDLFSLDLNRIKKIIKLLNKRDLSNRVTFSGAIRANLVNENVIQLLKQMGLASLGLGLESGCNKILKFLKRDNIKIEDNKNAIQIIKKFGIDVYGSFIIGSPQEDKKDILETLKFVKKSKLKGIGVYVLTPFPGTPVWEIARSKGLVNENMEWKRLNVNFGENHESAVIVSEKLTRKELYNLYLRFIRYQKKMDRYTDIKKGLKNPIKAVRYFVRKIS
ncbi:MAG: B12-binding domain-containing radical SAM protein [Promethearchaeota archaeon]